MPTGVVIDPEGHVTVTSIDGLPMMQHIVGGYIELRTTPAGNSMYLNEEGKLKMLPYNPLATALSGLQGDFIVGTVLLLGPPDGEGDDTDLPQDVIDALRSIHHA
jgi:hypothetical protein